MAVDIGSLQRQHPTWNIVDAIVAPNGGIWAVGADGGVFNLNPQGGTDGQTAPFFGSYTGLAAEQRQGDRNFVGIQADPATGGYTLISNRPGQIYNFVGNTPINQAPPPTAVPPPTTGLTFNDSDLNRLTAMLNQYGLGDLVDEAWKYYKDPGGAAGDSQAVLDWLPTTTQYQTRFPGLKELGEKGQAWTPAQWNSYFTSAQQAAASAGLPEGMISRDDIGKLINGNVSLGELQGRIQAAGQSVYEADPVFVQKMRDFGLSDGDLTAYYLDPDKAAPLLQRKSEAEQARIAAAGARGGYDISRTQAQGLQSMGVDQGEAEQGFGQLARMHPLFENLVGEQGQITTEEQFGAQFGQDAAAIAEIERRRAGRTAQFQGGGGSASGGSGRQGIG